MTDEQNSTDIKVFQDLRAYQNLYKAMVIVHTQIIPSLPKEERFDLVDQMRRASKAAPALIAEGFAKRYQEKQWKKYINDSMGEANEMIHHLSVCKDVHYQYVDTELCEKVIDLYVLACKQLTRLGQTWKNFHSKDQK